MTPAALVLTCIAGVPLVLLAGAWLALRVRHGRSAEARIVSAVAADPDGLSGAEISARAKMWSGTLYPALMRLERAGVLESWWLDESYPRRRVYRIAPKAPPRPAEGSPMRPSRWRGRS